MVRDISFFSPNVSDSAVFFFFFLKESAEGSGRSGDREAEIAGGKGENTSVEVACDHSFTLFMPLFTLQLGD